MAFTKMTTSVSNHQAVVGDDPGLTGDAFKALLDKAAEDIVDWANDTLLAELQATTGGSSAAERIGSATITGVSGNTPHAQMTDLKNQVDAVVLGTIPDDSLTDAKLAATAGQIKSRVSALQTFPTAGGTGTALTVDCDYFTLADGVQLSFVASANNSGAATTLNAEGKGAKSVYKPGGTDAPTFVSGKAYTVWYDLSDDCFFLKASAEGTAVAANVLAGTTFSNDADTAISGTMTDRAGDTVAIGSNISGTTLKLLASEGYRDGTNDYVTITDADFVAEKIKSGVNLFGVTGTYVRPDSLVGNKQIYSGGSANTGSTSYVKVIELSVNGAGALRIEINLSSNSGPITAYGRIYKNGSPVGTERSVLGSASPASFTEDISGWSVGDKLQVYCKISSAGYSALLNSITVKTDYNQISA